MLAEFFENRSEHGGDELTGMPFADVFNLQFSQGFIDHPAFFRSLAMSTPVVVTLHEMSPFTGGCSYAGNCCRFHHQCGNCPALRNRGERDLSSRIWLSKRASYCARTAESLHFVADSHWLAAEARKSGLLQSQGVSVIHYGLDTETFRPLDRHFARKTLHIPGGVPVVAFAAATLNDKRKGMLFVIECLTAMRCKPFLLTWGREFPPALKNIQHRHLGNIDNEDFMAVAYNAADVFLMPSLEEAFGQTALESIACGTPVVAFRAGGIVDIVNHEQTGLLAKVGDGEQLRTATERLLRDRKLWQALSAQGRQVAEEEFSMAVNAKQYIALYARMMTEQNSQKPFAQLAAH